MFYITTRVAPCVRYVLIRNAQCEKHMKQQEGDMEGSPGSDSVLTPQGDQMAKALGSLIEYLEKRPYCVPDGTEPDRKYNIVIDGRSQQHYDTSRYLRRRNKNVSVIYTNNVGKQLNFFKRDHLIDFIDVVIVFTDAKTITDFCKARISDLIHLGPALGSTTIFDVVPDNGIYVHEFGSLGALQYGGFDTSKLFWWNNAQ